MNFGYGSGAPPQFETEIATLEGILTPEQLAIWKSHGQPDPDVIRKALGLVAPMILRDPELLRNFGAASASANDK